MSQSWSVVIEERGREGTVRYRDGGRVMDFPWEFSGGDVVASVRVGTADEWAAAHPWASDRRAEIVERVASELIRQRASSCVARLDESSGWLHLEPARSRGGLTPPGPPPAPIGRAAPPSGPPATPAEFHRALSSLKAKVAAGVGVAALAVGGAAWIGRSALSIRTTGAPMGDSIRAGNTIATLIRRLDPYVPSLHRDASQDTYSVGILLHAADDGAPPRFVPLGSGHGGGSLGLSRFLGADAQRIWFRAPEPGAFDLQRGRVLDAAEFAAVQSQQPAPRIGPAELATGEAAVRLHLAAGGLTSPTGFVALLSEAEARSGFRVGSTAKPVVDMEETGQPMLLWKAQVGGDDSRRTLGPLSALPDAPIFHAGFLRDARNGGLLLLADPPGLLRVHFVDRVRSGTALLGRVDLDGRVRWQVDLGLARIDQILPDPLRPAFIGTRPAAPSTVPEPVLVVVDARSGAVVTRTLLVTD